MDIDSKHRNSFRTNFRTIIVSAALLIVIMELGGIWKEIHQLRNEQVKNAWYALPEEGRKRLKGTLAQKRRESTSFVNGDVSIDGTVDVEGTVDVDQPVEVEIDR